MTSMVGVGGIGMVGMGVGVDVIGMTVALGFAPTWPHAVHRSTVRSSMISSAIDCGFGADRIDTASPMATTITEQSLLSALETEADLVSVIAW
jgi:hypothetical protein